MNEGDKLVSDLKSAGLSNGQIVRVIRIIQDRCRENEALLRVSFWLGASAAFAVGLVFRVISWAVGLG